jgi:eukaryotic-like serine/threonine-protein kinase
MVPSTPAPAGPVEHAPLRDRTTWGTGTETEEGRAFYQQRLALCGLCMFLLSGGTWVLAALSFALIGGQPGPDFHPLRRDGLGWLVGALSAGVLWLSTRRGRRRADLLHALDVFATLALVGVFTTGAALQPNAVVGGFVALLCFTAVMLARAIVVPSPARRTFLLGVVGAVPLVVMAAWRVKGGVAGIGNAVASACWTSVGIGLGTVASHTIFGLRREVARARVLGQYTLEAKIGAGGMGEVWRASHALLRRPTAIKLLPPTRAGEAAIERFEREVQTTARLTHPSTVAIYDYGRTRQGVFYYAMELLEGIDLERLVAEHGPQPPARVAHVLAQVCGALAEAHDLGLVHRDVKPANVLLLPRHGEPELAKVVDFGLVKEVRAEHAVTGVTDANTITGTPLYMSPEAIGQPDAVGAASDVYAVGAVGWFLLVGRPPFEGQTIIEVCGKHLHAVPQRPSEALGQSLPSDLEDVLLACLAKRPAERPAGARVVRDRLTACGAAGQWGQAQAARWWDEHKLRPPAAPGQQRVADARSPGPRTLPLDVAGRGLATSDSA